MARLRHFVVLTVILAATGYLLMVGCVGQVRLHGRIGLLPGESNPGLIATLRFGDTTREMVAFKPAPDGSFIATYEPPDEWPVPVSLELSGIGFQSERTLEAAIPWGRFGGKEAVVKPADLVVMPFYDGSYRLHRVHPRDVSFEIVRPDRFPRRDEHATGGRAYSR